MRVLVIATRDPDGPQTGRKSVLRTVLSSLHALGHEVELAVVTRARPLIADRSGLKVHHLPPPGVAAIAARVGTHGVRRARSLNECLYDTPGLRRRVTQLAKDTSCDLVVADMIRTAELAFATQLPVILDLDDLLSARYRQLARSGADARTVLGYHRDYLPGAVAWLGGHLARRALRVEAATLERREASCARRASVVSVVSPVERATLAARAQRPVEWLPMAVEVQDRPAPVEANEPVVLFTANLDYEPNRSALRWYAEAVVPHLRPGLRLHVIGAASESVRADLASDAICFEGYADDLWAALRRGRAFAAPIVTGTGVKTKVLEALASGLPVVSTRKGVEGIEVTSGRSALVADDGAAFAAHLERLIDDDEVAARIGAAGRELVTAGYSCEVVTRRWAGVLEGLTGPDGRKRVT